MLLTSLMNLLSRTLDRDSKVSIEAWNWDGTQQLAATFVARDTTIPIVNGKAYIAGKYKYNVYRYDQGNLFKYDFILSLISIIYSRKYLLCLNTSFLQHMKGEGNHEKFPLQKINYEFENCGVFFSIMRMISCLRARNNTSSIN